MAEVVGAFLEGADGAGLVEGAEGGFVGGIGFTVGGDEGEG